MDTSELSWIFEMFDKNGDGRITKNELNDSLEKMGIFIPGNELSRMIDKVDDIGDGCFDVDEFESLFGSITGEEDMREAFSVFDQKGDGFITVEELKSVLGSLGLEGCQMMIMRVDERVDFTEFKKMMRGGGIVGSNN